MTTILAVDDSVTMRKCLEITFAGTEFNLVTCESAISALEKVKTLQPDLVIADVSLPPGDGYELCTTIKLAQPSLPVLMLTSKHNPFDAHRGGQADDHLDKPFDSQVLQDKARELIKEKPVGDTDIPKSYGDRPAPVLQQPRAVSVPQQATGQPRKRATPAMMASPVSPAAARRAPPMDPLVRRTVPFAVPPAAARTDLGAKADMAKTTPGVQPDEQSAGQPQARAKRDLSRTMAFGRMDADTLRRQVSAPRQAGARQTPMQAPGVGAGGGAVPGADVSGTRPFEQRSFDDKPSGTLPGVATGPSDEELAARRQTDLGQAYLGQTDLGQADLGPADSGEAEWAAEQAAAEQAAAEQAAAEQRAAGQRAAAQRAAAAQAAAKAADVKPLRETVDGFPSPAMAAATAATGNGSALEQKLVALGLDSSQVAGVLALSKEIVEQVVWEVVPTLAETLIKEEIRRLTQG